MFSEAMFSATRFSSETRRMRKTAVAKSAGMILIAALVAVAAPAAANDLTVRNNADVPVKIVVKKGGQEVGHSDRIEKKSSGKVTVKSAFSLTRCSAAKGGSQYDVACDAADPPGSRSASVASVGASAAQAQQMQQQMQQQQMQQMQQQMQSQMQMMLEKAMQQVIQNAAH
jgi:hypothetical protein